MARPRLWKRSRSLLPAVTSTPAFISKRKIEYTEIEHSLLKIKKLNYLTDYNLV